LSPIGLTYLWSFLPLGILWKGAHGPWNYPEINHGVFLGRKKEGEGSFKKLLGLFYKRASTDFLQK
jgi:hypothetical protein